MAIDLAPPAIVVAVEARVPLVLLQKPQEPPQTPRLDVAVEVVGELPMAAQVRELSRLLGVRQAAATGNFSRRYPPTVLELIRLVNPNPARPRGRAWDSVGALTIRYHAEPQHVIVEYCVDFCDHDPRTGTFNPKRKMVSYRAAQDLVERRLNKKLGELQKYAERPPS
jgi:hypothetical protein